MFLYSVGKLTNKSAKEKAIKEGVSHSEHQNYLKGHNTKQASDTQKKTGKSIRSKWYIFKLLKE